MSIWEPFHPVTYFLHTVIGVAGVLGGAVALSAIKGSERHVRAGRIFVGAAAIAALTALAFSITRFSAFAVVSSVIVISLLSSSLLSIRPRTRFVAVGEAVAALLMLLAALGLLLMAWLPFRDGAPLTIVAWPFAYALFPLWFVAHDTRFLWLDPVSRASRKLARHLSRMAFAFSIAVHAPVVSFGDRLGIDPAIAFFGPFVLWPIIVLATRRTEHALTAAAT